jgi:hypothetical protein
MEKKTLSLIIFACCFYGQVLAQGSVGIGTVAPDLSAMLDISSTTRGLLLPRMSTTQRTAIPAPASGLMVFDTNTETVWTFTTGSGWTQQNGLAPAAADRMLYATTSGGWFPGSFLKNHQDTAVSIGNNGLAPMAPFHVERKMHIGRSIWTSAANDRYIGFGDLDITGLPYVYLGEAITDDRLYFKANSFQFSNGRIGMNTVPDATAILNVNGQLRITDGTEALGKVLTGTGSGYTNWQYPAAYNTGCAVYIASGVTITHNVDARVPFTSELYDDGNNFDNTTNNAYVAPAAGLYHFDISLAWNLASVGASYKIRLLLGVFGTGNEMASWYDVAPGTNGLLSTQLSTNLKLAAGQNVVLFAYQNSGVAQGLNNGYTSFRAYRVY